MTPERWQQVKDIFDGAVECGPASRVAYIGEHCGGDEELRREVESLLASDTETGSLLYNPLLETSKGEARRTDPHSLEGRLIGPYLMQREIGRGGMGVVYLASRADRAFQRLVAIKVVNVSLGSAETIARFEQEREILASLDHPNIARLIDGGTTPDGLSYLVMEYVEGRAIDVYCDEHKLDIPARLQFFRTVCAAVEYAHQKHIIHRDIKPANILVTADGTVKLLDFGIAKLMPGRDVEATLLITRTGMRLMTPEYASPEQIRGEAVGAATDVYALGVVLYELLTGQLPYRLRSRVFHEIVRAVCEEPPTRPSTAGKPGDVDHISRVRRTSPADLRKCLAGDLDGIILKALEKQPYDRYRSAAILSNDIEQHLEGRPVAARQATLGYRADKFMRRNLPWILLLAALATALATGGITINRTGAIVIGACVLAVGVWYAATSQALGRRIAESESWFARTSGRTFYYVIVLNCALISLDLTVGPTRLWARYLAVSFTLVLLAVFIRQTIGWVGRRRSAGGLLFDMSTERGYRLAVPVTLFCMAASIGVPVYLHTYDLLSGLNALSSLYIGLAFFLEGRREIRERGIVIEGTLYSWDRIESHEWRPLFGKGWLFRRIYNRAEKYALSQVKYPPWITGEREREAFLAAVKRKAASLPAPRPVLRFRLRGDLQFLPPVQFFVPLDRKDRVEAVISRYLSEWPATGKATVEPKVSS